MWGHGHDNPLNSNAARSLATDAVPHRLTSRQGTNLTIKETPNPWSAGANTSYHRWLPRHVRGGHHYRPSRPSSYLIFTRQPQHVLSSDRAIYWKHSYEFRRHSEIFQNEPTSLAGSLYWHLMGLKLPWMLVCFDSRLKARRSACTKRDRM